MTTTATLPSPSFLSRFFAAPAGILPRTHEMARGAIYRIEQPDGCRVACLSGSIWVTQDRDPRDIMLAAGEDCRITGNARVLVQALEAARISLS